MNRIAKRSWFTVVLSGMLIVGLLGILVRYTLHAEQWAAFSRSPYIYHTGGREVGYYSTPYSSPLQRRTYPRCDPHRLRLGHPRRRRETQGRKGAKREVCEDGSTKGESES